MSPAACAPVGVSHRTSLVNATEPLRRAARCWPDREAHSRRRARAHVPRAGGAGESARPPPRVASASTRGDRVATSLPNSSAHVVAQLAVVRAGGAWVGINRRLAPREVGVHAGALRRARLADGRERPAARGAAARGPRRQRRRCRGRAPPRRRARRCAGDADHRGRRRRLRYTSGTTGRPKAAVLAHGSALASLRNLLAELHELGPDDTSLHVAPLTHASEALLAPAFWRGARIDRRHQHRASALADTIARERVTTLFLVPTMIARPRGCPSAARAGSLREPAHPRLRRGARSRRSFSLGARRPRAGAAADLRHQRVPVPDHDAPQGGSPRSRAPRLLRPADGDERGARRRSRRPSPWRPVRSDRSPSAARR